MAYTHLNFEQRCKISAFWKAGYQQKDIAKEIGVNPSTVSRELKRNRHGLFAISHERIYQYVLADKKSGGKLYLHLRCGKKKYRKRYGSPYHSWERGLNENTHGLIRQYISKGSSFADLTPEQIKKIENHLITQHLMKYFMNNNLHKRSLPRYVILSVAKDLKLIGYEPKSGDPSLRSG